MKHVLVALKLVLGAVLWAVSTYSWALEPGKRETISSPEIYDMLSSKKKKADLEAFVAEVCALPLYSRLSVAQEIAAGLTSEERVQTVGYEWLEGEHDLSRYAGRAAWVLAEAMKLRLPCVTPQSSKADLKKAADVASELISARCMGAAEYAAEYGALGNTDGLRTRYKDRIKPGPCDEEALERSSKAIWALMKEVFPIGKKLSYIEEIVGKKAEMSKDGTSAMYFFQAPFVGSGVVFSLQDGVIRSVTPALSQ